MLNIINERNGKGDDRFTPMNLSSMLNARTRDLSKLTSDSSLSPHSPRDHDRDEDADRGDLDHDNPEEDGAADSSGGPPRDERHLSDEVRAQVFADLRRFRGSIPTQSGGGGGDQQATSTTTSPPPSGQAPNSSSSSGKLSPSADNAGGSSTVGRSISCEDNLPPRKRKVSQEHHLMESSYNGVHHDDEGSKQSRRDSRSGTPSAGGSPAKPHNEDEPSMHTLDCRN